MSLQYNQFLSYSNFHLAFKRLQTVDGFSLYKNLYRPDIEYFGFFLEDAVKVLTHNIEEGLYEPAFGKKIYVPKKNNLVRPLTLLDFFDLMVYQALVNVIADVVYDEMSLLRSKNILFGNSFKKSTDDDAIFFLDKWKNQWKNYNTKTEEYFNEGYTYFTDFDIASFFDTISHDILINQLIVLGVEVSLCDLLKKCLHSWSIDEYRKNAYSGHGIPQGPIASSILADIYLIPIDKKVANSTRLNIKYQRYVDDIRILSKNELEGKKAIAYLDLLSRDFGLIPQSSKIGTKKVDNIKKELSFQHTKLSNIANEFYRLGGLNQATHNKQKRQFLNCFVKQDNADFLNKTIIRFSLYKLNKDEEIKASLLANIEQLYPHIDAVLLYLSKHFADDASVHAKLVELLKSDSLLFQHIIAIIYKTFPHLRFTQQLFDAHYTNNKPFWLIKYFMLDWLQTNAENELISTLPFTNFYFINRKLLSLKFKSINSGNAKRNLLVDNLNSDNDMLSMQALFHHFWEFYNFPPVSVNMNTTIKSILQNQLPNYINSTLANNFGVALNNTFFDAAEWEEPLFNELRSDFQIFNQSRLFNPSQSLMCLNLFNEIVFNAIANRFDIIPSDKYGGNIATIADKLPYVSFCFTQINTARNEKTEAHYKDHSGNVRLKISFYELEQLIKASKFTEAMQELCNYNF